ncbi:heparin lyase I family protein [Zobellia galactanivorans]|uniref:heparin lyase I family protein n=1 Tax=Zobellia galactanivorans (strain DSM 12802 / CCUG 47099 / CIP 106680 / NCIMB 13871 / Dsij) TaxID=63186 RepID=UPI0026E3044B|nr:heparin lyase I family protein [Zobellia galactanivorans]MDO6808074.1 heparin lyase I family protein [Zobellia galactanivorans]
MRILMFFICASVLAQGGRKISIQGQDQAPTTIGKAADEFGFRQWNWSDFEDDINSMSSEGVIDSGNLYSSVHYYNSQSGNTLYVSDSRLNFHINPNTPEPSGEAEDYNYRSEIREHPSNADNETGTEQWWGFNYKFGDGYVADENEFIMWQVHGSFATPSNPLLSMWVGKTNQAGTGNKKGEILIVNAAQNSASHKYTKTGIVPKSGQSINVVIHVIWGDASDGLYQVWIDGKKVYDEQERTVYIEEEEAGYWKIGIYKWPWKNSIDVAVSEGLGADDLHTSIGSLRVITREPSDLDNNKNWRADYEKVDPARYEY